MRSDSRILLVSTDAAPSGGESLRRRILRFTGSRRATRMILRRIDEARRAGQVLTCMITPGPGRTENGTDHATDWVVRVSFARQPVRYHSKRLRARPT